MGTNAEIETYLEVVCSCGQRLEAESDLYRGNTTITVKPCPVCMAESRVQVSPGVSGSITMEHPTTSCSGYNFACSVCDYDESVETPNLEQAITRATADGWLVMEKDGIWQCLCPSCKVQHPGGLE